MFTPADAIAELDGALLLAGETAAITHFTGPTGNPRPSITLSGIPVSVRAVKAEEMVGNIDQTASNVVVSPTGLVSILPLVKGDKITIQGRVRNIELAKPIYMRNVLVRIDILVLG